MKNQTITRLGWFMLVLAVINMAAVFELSMPTWKQVLVSAAPFVAAQILLIIPVYKHITNTTK